MLLIYWEIMKVTLCEEVGNETVIWNYGKKENVLKCIYIEKEKKE
jgi:hypothetical protein